MVQCLTPLRDKNYVDVFKFDRFGGDTNGGQTSMSLLNCSVACDLNDSVTSIQIDLSESLETLKHVNAI